MSRVSHEKISVLVRADVLLKEAAHLFTGSGVFPGVYPELAACISGHLDFSLFPLGRFPKSWSETKFKGENNRRFKSIYHVSGTVLGLSEMEMNRTGPRLHAGEP